MSGGVRVFGKAMRGVWGWVREQGDVCGGIQDTGFGGFLRGWAGDGLGRAGITGGFGSCGMGIRFWGVCVLEGCVQGLVSTKQSPEWKHGCVCFQGARVY